MKLSGAAIGLAAVSGLAAVGAGLMVARRLARARADSGHVAEPPPPEQLIGPPQARLSALDAAEALRPPPDRAH